MSSKYIFSFLLCLSLSLSVSAQVPTYRGVQVLGRHSYNFETNTSIKPRLRKSKELRIVFSDRANNLAFTTPYAQRTASVQELGTAYYIIGEKNGHYELVLANAKSIGKPKGLFGFLHSRHRHFKEASSAEYIGWMPKNKLLFYNHAFISDENHRPLLFQIGITNTKRLYDLHRHLKEDSLSIYSDPYLKESLPQKLTMGSFAYVYKYDETRQAALVSDKPTLFQKGEQVIGWIPSNMIAYVGQHHCFEEGERVYNSLLKGELLKSKSNADSLDSISFRLQNLQSQTLFTQDYRIRPNNDSVESKDWAINLPFSVWDHSKNKLINIKGGEIPISVIKQMERGQKRLNIHLLYFEHEKTEVKRLINSFQSIALKMKPHKIYSYSASVISRDGNRYLDPTKNFSAWLDFLLDDAKVKPVQEHGLSSALQHFVQKSKPNLFEDNLFFLLGSDQDLSLSNSLLNNLSERGVSLVVLQLQRGTSEAHQDFLLQGKELLSQYISRSDDYLSNYIVDPMLVKPSIFVDHSKEASIYLLDVPESSLTAGGIVFPPAGEKLSNVALETVLDTLSQHVELRNELLLRSLVSYEKKLGVLRSEPAPPLVQLHKKSAQRDLPIAEIDRNSSSDTYYEAVWMPDSVLNKTHTEGYLYTADEVKELIQSYRDLLPQFSDNLSKKELKMLRRLYKRERKQVNTQNYRKLLTRRASIAQIFYFKTGVWPGDVILYELRPCKLRRRRAQRIHWEEHYRGYLHQIKSLEEDFINNRLRARQIGGKTYYFIAKEQLP